jgi:uncharacterized protein
VEKAICADPKLAVLDHQIANAYASLTKVKGSRAGAAVLRAQRNFIAEHNGGFGQPGHDLQPAMQRRLDALQAEAHGPRRCRSLSGLALFVRGISRRKDAVIDRTGFADEARPLEFRSRDKPNDLAHIYHSTLEFTFPCQR